MRWIMVFLIFACIFSGCGYDFKMPVVVSADPVHNELSVNSDTVITVVFSAEMDTMKTCDEFSLSCSSGKVDGYFAWQHGNRELVFTPAEPLGRARKYIIRVTDSAEDVEGNDLKEEFVSVFYTGGDDIKPYLDVYTPAANSTGNPVNTGVRIWFSEAMDPDTIYDGISITPAVEGFFSWEAGNTEAVFTVLKGLNYGTTYTIKVNSSMKDAAGNSLENDQTFSFTVGDDFVQPGLTVYQDNAVQLSFDENLENHGAEKNGSIVINFTERVITDRIAEAVSVSPASAFYITTVTENSGGTEFTRAVIHFTENLNSQEMYTLRIGSSITDLQENSLLKDYRFVFVTDGADSVSPVVTGIGDPAGTWTMNIVPLRELAAGDTCCLNIGIAFSHPVDPLSLQIAADVVIGSGSPKIVNIDWPDTAANGQFSLLNFGLHNVTTGVTYRIIVKGGQTGLKDLNGNYMKEDFVQLVKFIEP